MPNLERIFTPKVLLAINLALIVISLTWGGGKTYYDTGAVHIVALLFIALAISRLFQDFGVTDLLIRGFVRASVVALLFFAASHLVEFLTEVVFKLPDDAQLVSVYAVYAASFLFFTLGIQFVLRRAGKRATAYSWLLVATVTLLVSAIVYVMVRPASEFSSVTPPGAALALYGVALVAITAFQMNGFSRISSTVPALRGMKDKLNAASIFIILSALPNIAFQLYGETLTSWGVTEIHMVYLSHYGFYAAASMLYLAFGELKRMGGVYSDMQAMAGTAPKA